MQANIEMVKALTLNDECNNQRISENKEVAALLLAIDKYFCWNPYLGENCVFEDFDEAVSVKYSHSSSGIGLPTHSINLPFFIRQ